MAERATAPKEVSEGQEAEKLKVRAHKIEPVPQSAVGAAQPEASKGSLIDRYPKTSVGVGVAAAAGVGLLLANLIGVGEVAIAGAAGYMAYRRFTKKAA